jgi:hypothetical protein
VRHSLVFLFVIACGSPHDFGSDASTDAPTTFPDVQLGEGGATCSHFVQETYDPGPDGILGTNDDVLRPGREVQIAQPFQQISVATRDTTYSGPGSDGKWDTADDVIVRDERVVATSSTTYDDITYDGAGADGTWGTDDDHVYARTAGTGPIVTPSEVHQYSAPGPDNVWGTSDDVAGSWSKFVYGDGTSAPFLQEWQYTSASTLGIVTSRFTGWGMFSLSAGADKAWGTKDDALSSRYVDERNTNGRFQTLTSYGPGPDQTYFTTDDVILGLATITCSDGVYDGRIVIAPGPDQTWDTADDIVQVRLRTTACGACGDLPHSPVAPN